MEVANLGFLIAGENRLNWDARVSCVGPGGD